MKFIKTSIGFLLLVFAGFFALTVFYSAERQPAVMQQNAFEEVIKYEPLIEQELATYQLEEYTPLVLALMQQESKGRGETPCRLQSQQVCREMPLPIRKKASGRVWSIFKEA